MKTSIRHHLTNLLDFRGREARGTFWPYVAVIVIGGVAAMGVLLFPLVLDSMTRMQKFAAEHPEMATVTRTSTSYSVSIRGDHPELMPDFGAFIARMAAVIAMMIVLLASAVVRRLHDAGRAGFWALPPALLLTTGMVLMMQHSRLNLEHLFPILFLNNLVYLATLGLLVFRLASPGEKGANRYGPAINS